MYIYIHIYAYIYIQATPRQTDTSTARTTSERSARDIYRKRGRGCVCMTRRIPIQLATREGGPQAKGVREIYTGREGEDVCV